MTQADTSDEEEEHREEEGMCENEANRASNEKAVELEKTAEAEMEAVSIIEVSRIYI